MNALCHDTNVFIVCYKFDLIFVKAHDPLCYNALLTLLTTLATHIDNIIVNNNTWCRIKTSKCNTFEWIIIALLCECVITCYECIIVHDHGHFHRKCNHKALQKPGLACYVKILIYWAFLEGVSSLSSL